MSSLARLALARSLTKALASSKGAANCFALSRVNISSSEKKPAGHVGAAPHTVIDNPPRTAEDFADAAKNPRNWISYGYFEDDRELDRDLHALMMFGMVTLSTVFLAFIIGYLPDWRMQDWGVRQAHLELARREKNGLPPVDRELIPLDRIELPSEEELVGQRVFL